MTLIHDRFPVRLTVPGHATVTARIIIADGMLHGFTSPTALAPGTPLPVTLPIRRADRGTSILGSDAGDVTWTPDPSCGCSDPLKRVKAAALLAVGQED